MVRGYFFLVDWVAKNIISLDLWDASPKVHWREFLPFFQNLLSRGGEKKAVLVGAEKKKGKFRTETGNKKGNL